MNSDEQSVRSKAKAAGKAQKQRKRINEAERRAAELPGNEASIAAELKNREK